MVAGLTPNSFYNMQLNAGAFFENVDLSGVKTIEGLRAHVAALLQSGENCLGATKGGGSFKAVPKVRQIEADGMRSPIIGSTVFDNWEISLSTTLKEITKGNMKRALSSADVEKDGAVDVVRLRNTLMPGDYIKNLAWVGDLLDGRMVLIRIDNALNISGANFEFEDKGEGEIKVEFRGHQSDLGNMEYAPCEIFFFNA